MLVVCMASLGITSQEISVYVSGGLQGLNNSYSRGTSTLNVGGNLGFQYSFGIAENFSIITGVEVGLYGNGFGLDNYNFTSNEIDDQGSAFEYRVQIQNYAEESNFQSVNIPLLLQFRPNIRFPMYINVGGKIIVPSQQNVESSAQQVQTSGFFPNFNVLIDNLPQRGFGNLNTLSTEKNNNLTTAFAASLEIGTIISLRQNKIYLGAYVDYGLTDARGTIITSQEQPLVSYSPQGVNEASLNNTLTSFVDTNEAKILAYGIQLKYSFGMRKRRKRWNAGCF